MKEHPNRINCKNRPPFCLNNPTSGNLSKGDYPKHKDFFLFFLARCFGRLIHIIHNLKGSIIIELVVT